MISKRKIILRGHTPSSTKSFNGGREYSYPILPNDLITEIFSRLPAKSVARFRCLSKLWASILRGSCPYFTELFSTRSSSRPRILFAFIKGNEVFFFSIPQLQNHDEKLSHVIATYVMKNPFRISYESISHIHGLVFFRKVYMSWLFTEVLSAICNPSTEQSLVVPTLPRTSNFFWGYNPIEKQYKLLLMRWKGYKVLTLGSGKLLWRDVLCSTAHYPLCNGICINGVFYYKAMVNNSVIMVACFDIRSEKFHFIKVMENFSRAVESTFIDYNGKLGSFISDGHYYRNKNCAAFEIWVLEDPKKHEWSKYIHVLPPLWKNIAGEGYLYFIGMISTDEIMFSMPKYVNDSFYVIYYNMKKKSVAKVEIQGIEACKGSRVFTFLNHIEDLKLLY